ncbi:hypothetical protein ACHQM5_024752 [Ranunculus cassubicifolius]
MEPVTGAVVSVLVNQLYGSLANENQTLRGFKEEFEKTRKKFHLMTSFLVDLQLLQRQNEDYMTIKAILAGIRELVYDADDILLDCQTRAAHEEISLFHGRTPRGWSFRRNAANMLSQIQKRIEEMEEQLKAYLPTVGQMIQRQNSEEGSSQGRKSTPRRTPHVLGQSKMIGLEEDTRKIIGWITAKERSRCIGIVGMGGMGKTTITQEIFNNQQVVDHFQERIWVTFSQVFSEKDIVKSMMTQLRVDVTVPKIDEMSQIHQSLKNKNYLIVMDDVWDIDDDWWRLLSSYLPEGEACSKSIIITTRKENVATKMGVTFIHRTRKLNPEESWSLFCEFAFDSKKKRSEDSEFQELGKEIVFKCEGFPLAIKTIAGLLSSKSSRHQWQAVSTNFRHEMNNNTSVSATLQLSYDDLPANLKHCILSFSIYPEDCNINGEQLVYWWVGEGFVNGNGQRTAIEEAFECLSELVSRCLVAVVKQRGYDGRVFICKMHDMVRDLVIKMSKEEVFSSFDIKNKQIADRNSRHMGYTSEMKEGFEENNSKLRAFLLMENCELPLQKGAGLATVNSLRVLDLSKNEQESISVADLWNWIKSQKRLAYIHLRKVAGVIDHPDWLRKRYNLQILVLTECNNLETLPSSMTNLQNLIVLDVESCPLQKLPQGLGKLTKLQILYGFKMASSRKDGARLGDLMALTELRELGIILSKNDEIAADEENILSQLQKLKVLYMDTKDCEQKQIVLVNKLVPPRSLRELYLRSYHGETTPNWVSPSVIPELLYLYIDHAQLTGVGPNFWGDGESAWKIEGLCFKHLLRFKLEYKKVKENMKYLRYVEVSHCQGLDTFPCDINNYGTWEKEEDDEWRLQDEEEEEKV